MFKVYLGIAVREDYDILKALWKLRQDFGASISAYYYREQARRKAAQRIHDLGIPFIVDNGAVQTFKMGKDRVPDSLLRDCARELDADFLFAPDIIGKPEDSIQRMLQFVNENNDLELLCPLQSVTYGPLFKEKVDEEIAVLHETGCERFGIGRPYGTKMTSAMTLMEYGPMVRPKVRYLHFMGFPMGGHALRGINFLDSADVGTYTLVMKYRYDAFGKPDQSAKILSAMLDIDYTMCEIRREQQSAAVMRPLRPVQV